MEVLHMARKLHLCQSRLLPCQLFVASDSASSLHEVEVAVHEQSHDHDVHVEIIGAAATRSQQKSAVGVELSSLSPGADAYAMAVEVLYDIEMLSRAKIIVGTLASQVFRIAASIGIAYDTLLRAVALDIENLPEMHNIFDKLGISVDDVPWYAPELYHT